MNYYKEIKTKLIENENYAKIKDYSKERYKVQTYYEIGKILSEAGKHYGEDIIGQYAAKLQTEVGKKYNKRTLFRMKQFYSLFKDTKMSAMPTQLTWSHYCELLTLKSKTQIEYYITIAKSKTLTYRELHDIIKNKEYERVDESTRLKLINEEKLSIQELIKNPIIINNPKNKMVITEKTLKEIIIENLDAFLLELGNSFSYIANEYKIKLGDRYNYIDLLLYNYQYNCFVVIELKVTELKKEHIGQIETYMHYIDKNLKTITQDNTIGIIICKKDNHFIMEYCSDTRILSREYKLTGGTS